MDEKTLVKNNEVGLGESPKQENGQQSNVLMTVAEEESLFNNTEVLAGEENGVCLICQVNSLIHFIGPKM